MPRGVVRRRVGSLKPYIQRSLTMAGGIRRDLSPFVPGNGLWKCDGFHTNQKLSLKKWPGFVKDNPTGLGARADGLYQVTLSGTTYKIGMAGGIIKRIDIHPPVNIAAGQASAPYDARVLGNFVFLVNGADENKKIDAALGFSKMGIAAPTAAPEVVQGVVGSVSGTYKYKYTFANSTTNVESDPSLESSAITVAKKKVDLSGIHTSSDPQVDRVRIYRTVDGGARFLFVGEMTNGTATYTDNLIDVDLGSEVSDSNGVPPLGKYLEVYNGMIVVAGLSAPQPKPACV